MEQISVYQLTRDGCPPYLPTTTNRDRTEQERCAQFQHLAIDEIVRLRQERNLRAVVLSAAWVYQDREIEARLPGTLDFLGALGLRILIIGPTPGLRYKAVECLLRHEERFCAWPKAEYERNREKTMREFAGAIAGRAYVKFLDPTPFFCDENRCRAARNGQILYTDASHVSASASRSFAGFARTDLSWLR